MPKRSPPGAFVERWCRLGVDDAVALGFLAVAVVTSHLVGRRFQLALRGFGGLAQVLLLERVEGLAIIAFLVVTALWRYRRRPLGGGRVRDLLLAPVGIARALLPIVLVFMAYSNLKILIHSPHDVTRDQWLRQLDTVLLGGWDPVAWAVGLERTRLLELLDYLYAAFVFYFPLSVPLAYIARDPGRYRRFSLTVILIHVLGLSGYFACPTYGPFVLEPGYFRHLTLHSTQIKHGLILFHQQFLTNPTAYQVRPFNGIAAMPSLHAALSLYFVLAAWRDSKVVFVLYIPATVGLWISTVTTGFHYVVDLVAGAGVTLLAMGLASLLQRGYERLVPPTPDA